MAQPERLGRYTLGDRIGEGGMGVVFRGHAEGAEGFSKTVAIKMLHEALVRDPGIREALVREARTAQRLSHGNIVQVLDVGLDGPGPGARPYLVLEYVDGGSLAELMRAARPDGLPIGDALAIAEAVAAALAYAHRAGGPGDGVVHRDVSPRNILVAHDGVVKLADFGIAKALGAPSYTLPGTFKGSLGYLAPEQARGEPVDARADQFAVGIVLHEMLAGVNPIAARDIAGYHAALAAGVPALPVGASAAGAQPVGASPVTARPMGAPVDAALAAIVGRATAIDPAARYGSMDELRGELEAWRVERKLRTSTESLRDTVRRLLGTGATLPGERRLGDLLAGRLASTAVTTKRGGVRVQVRPAPARRGRVIAAAAGVVAIGVALAVAASRAPGSTARAPDAAPAGVVATHAAAPVVATPAIARGADAVARAADLTAMAAASARGSDAAPDPASEWGSDAAPDPAIARGPDVTRGAGHDAAAASSGHAAARGAVARPGRLRVNVVPWARVALDGRPLGGVPVDAEVAAGRHRLTLTNPETGEQVDKPIVIEPSREVMVTSW